MTNHPNRGKPSRNALELIATLSAGGVALNHEQQAACNRLCRSAVRYKHLLEEGCNGPAWANRTSPQADVWASWETGLAKRQAACEARLSDDSRIIAAGVFFQGDPRGATVKLVMPDHLSHLHNDMGREGLCVPGS